MANSSGEPLDPGEQVILKLGQLLLLGIVHAHFMLGLGEPGAFSGDHQHHRILMFHNPVETSANVFLVLLPVPLQEYVFTEEECPTNDGNEP